MIGSAGLFVDSVFVFLASLIQYGFLEFLKALFVHFDFTLSLQDSVDKMQFTQLNENRSSTEDLHDDEDSLFFRSRTFSTLSKGKSLHEGINVVTNRELLCIFSLISKICDKLRNLKGRCSVADACSAPPERKRVRHNARKVLLFNIISIVY